MAPPKRPWFRFYTEALTDPKMRRLTPEQRWVWVAVLGAARQSPVPGTLLLSADLPMEARDLAELAGVTTRKASVALEEMEQLGMVERDDSAWVVSAWGDRQYESDDSTDRAAKSRRRNNDATPMQRPIDVDATPPENREQRTDTEKIKSVVEPAPPTSTALVLVSPDPPALTDPVTVVFDAWRTATGHDRAKLTNDRRDRIRKWLKAGYSPDDLADACRGITLSEFHMGANDRHAVYDDLSVALKDSRNIERFMGLHRDGPPARTRPQPKSADTIRRLAQGGDL